MLRVVWFSVFALFFASDAVSQSSYYFSRHIKLPPQLLTAQSTAIKYPINLENTKAIGMGGAQIANGNFSNSMLYNPAFLGSKKTSVDLFSLQTSLPPETYDAALFLKDNMNEFEDAVSLTEVWNGVNSFCAPNATLEQRLQSLNQIQDGMQFCVDLLEQVIGNSENPTKHGLGIMPSISVQKGNWGFALFGGGYSGFLVQQSPTIDALLAIDIPTNLDHPLQAVKAATQILGTLATVVVGGGESFDAQVFPVAFYLSYVDMVGVVGYGIQVKDNWQFGTNLKIVNRRFAVDRIPVIDYDQILSDAWNKLKTNTTGFTMDVGALYKSSFKTSFGVSVQNVIPMQSLKEHVEFEFRIPRIIYDRDAQGKIITNTAGDTALASTSRNLTLQKPFELKAPLLVNFGINHPITSNWDIAFDWVDIAEQDSRYRKTTEHLRLGTEYRFGIWKNQLLLSLRTGYADDHVSGGFGFNITKYFKLDGAYAYDRFVKSYSYFTQLRICM